MFHGAVVGNLDKDPVPPPHPDIVRFFDPPNRVLRKAREALEAAKRELKVKQGQSICISRALGMVQLTVPSQYPKQSRKRRRRSTRMR